MRLLAIAAGDADIVLAWASAGPGGHGVHLARFGADLAPIEHFIVDARPTGPIALARSAAGYVLAFEAADGVHIQPLDVSAHPRGPQRTIAGALRPALAARSTGGAPAGGPLLTWRHKVGGAMDLQAAVLADDGSQIGSPASGIGSACFTDDASVFNGRGFLVAACGATPGSGVRIASVGLDGALDGSAVLQAGADAPRLLWMGREARLIYGDTSGATWWLALNASGARVGSPQLLIPEPGPGPEHGAISPVYVSGLAVGGAALVLYDTVIASFGLPAVPGYEPQEPPPPEDVAWVWRWVPDRTPQDREDTVVIKREPMAGVAMTRLGADFVVAWLARDAPHHVGLARGGY
jgi:hypothetical protein